MTQSTGPIFPNVTVRLALTGRDGNAFVVIGTTKEALVKAGHRREANLYVQECFKRKSYEEVLDLTRKTVTFIDLSAPEHAKFWGGLIPKQCDTCRSPITVTFYDMKTKMGPWGNLCPTCALAGPGVGKTGTGLGQKYELQNDGRWLKTEG